MSPEAQRIAVAEADGWAKGRHKTLDMDVWRKGGFWATAISLPGYLSDLNAMHEASVNILCLKKTIVYQDNICAILRRDALATEQEARIMCIDAIAAQRCEAFLRTLNKWTDSPPEQRSEPEGKK